MDALEREQYNAAKRERYRTDPEYRARIRFQCNRAKRTYMARASQEHRNLVNLLDCFRKMVARHLNSGKSLLWKTHVVEYTRDTKVHRCVSCGLARLPGSRLWWRRIQDGAYECFPCFTQDMSKAAPLGYEDWMSSRLSKYALDQSVTSKESSTEPDLGPDPRS